MIRRSQYRHAARQLDQALDVLRDESLPVEARAARAGALVGAAADALNPLGRRLERLEAQLGLRAPDHGRLH